jgi:hypothetical protein
VRVGSALVNEYSIILRGATEACTFELVVKRYSWDMILTTATEQRSEKASRRAPPGILLQIHIPV